VTTAHATLRFVTYLAPSIPEAFYRSLAERLAAPLGLDWALEVDARRSGPQPDADPFSRGCADVGFMCAPCYQELRDLPAAPVELLVAPVYDDPRNAGRPVYYSEVVVRGDAPWADFAAAAREARWAYNDEGSLSGYHSVLRQAQALGLGRDVFADAVNAGSHLNALDLLARGGADAAAIDANVLALRLHERPDALAGLRVVDTLGPHPVQPVVVRAGLPDAVKHALREAFLALDAASDASGLLARYRITRLVPVDDADYPERRTDRRRRRG